MATPTPVLPMGKNREAVAQLVERWPKARGRGFDFLQYISGALKRERRGTPLSLPFPFKGESERGFRVQRS